MCKNYSILALLLCAMLSAPAAEFYAAPNGLPSGTGAISNPWSLQTALGQPGNVVRPGDTIWLRGGSYTGATNVWINYLNGTAATPIIVRQYPGERATVNGGIYSGGSYTWFWGFEITNPDPERNVFNNFARPQGIELHGRGVKAINLIVHDTGHPGIGFWKQIGDGAEVYGCIVWGNGFYDWSSGSRNIRGSGIYGQGETRDENRYIKDSIFFRNFTQGIHLYSTGAGVYVNGVHVEGNIFFNNGDAKENLFIGTVAQPCERIDVRNNVTYYTPGEDGTGIRLGYGALGNTNLVVRDNYIVGGSTSLRVEDWLGVTIVGNAMLASNERLIQMNYGSGAPILSYLCNSNTYSTPYSAPLWYSDNVGAVSFAQWKTATGYDLNSTLTTANPSVNKVFVRRNQYERGRAHIAVFNWGLQPTVSVDIAAAGLNNGEGYEIRDVQNYFGPPVVTGTYNGAPVTLPMNLTNAPALVGNVTHIVNRHTASDFNSFIVVPLAGPPAPNTPPAISAIAPQTINQNSATAAIPFTIADAETPAASLAVTATSSNPTLVPNAGIVLGGSGAARSVTVTPASNRSGVATITVSVSDGQAVTSSSFNLTVLAINQAPVVNAGSDRTIYLPATASLNGTATDDGQPAPASLSIAWSKLSGPGTVTFSNPGAAATTAGFSTNGAYTLRLTASDGLLTTTDDVIVSVQPAGSAGPAISGVAPVLITETTAIIVWNTDVPADSQIEYGTNASYGFNTPLAAALSTDHGLQLIDLLPGTPYHFRVKSRNAQNVLAVSSDATFNTLPAPIAEKIYLPIEAESGVLTSPMSMLSDGQASQGKCIVSSGGGGAVFTVKIPAAGDYTIWSRVIAFTSNNDSFFVSVDGGPEDVFDCAEGKWSPVWQWSRVNGRNGSNPLTLNPRVFTLAEGTHTLVFRTRDPITYLDRLLITNDPDFAAGADPLAAATNTVLSLLIKPGYTLLANQFDRGGNTVAEIMPVVPEGTLLYRFDNTIKNFVLNRFTAGSWIIPNQTLPPGEGGFIVNTTASPFRLLLTGQVRDANLPLPVTAGLNMVSSRTLRMLQIQDVLGFTPLPGDTVSRFDNASSTFKRYAFDVGGWNSIPTLRLGEAAFVQLVPR